MGKFGVEYHRNTGGDPAEAKRNHDIQRADTGAD